MRRRGACCNCEIEWIAGTIVANSRGDGRLPIDCAVVERAVRRIDPLDVERRLIDHRLNLPGSLISVMATISVPDRALNDRQDNFGETVKIAAREQSQVDASATFAS